MPNAVSGFTKQDAPSAAVVPSGSTRHCWARMRRYCAYIAPPSTATVLPSSAWAAGELPAATTTPAPSLPTGMGSSRRPFMPRICASGTRAVITGRSGVPDWTAVLMSAAPNNSPRSDGLIGVASRRISTSSGPGVGTGTAASDTSSSPVPRMRERSCSAVSGIVRFIARSPWCVRCAVLRSLRSIGVFGQAFCPNAANLCACVGPSPQVRSNANRRL